MTMRPPLPRVIENEKENELMIAELEKLDTRGRPLTPEEEKLAELMTLLIEQYEQSRYPLGHSEPVEALRVLMEDRGLVVSDVLHEKRAISKAHARKLAEFFHVPVSLFI